MEVKISKTDWYYLIEEEKRDYIYTEPTPKKIKLITLEIIKELPKEIKEKIIDKLTMDSLKEEYRCEKIIKECEKEEIMLYCKDYGNYN